MFCFESYGPCCSMVWRFETGILHGLLDYKTIQDMSAKMHTLLWKFAQFSSILYVHEYFMKD